MSTRTKRKQPKSDNKKAPPASGRGEVSDMQNYSRLKLIITKKMKEQKPPARGGFTPFKQPTGRRLFEAQEKFRPLRRAA